MSAIFWKRSVSLLLALVMLLGMMPMTAFAEEAGQATEETETVEEPAKTGDTEEEASDVPTDTEEDASEVPADTEEEASEVPADTEKQDAHEHKYASVETAPTCTDQGYTTYTCECSDSYVDDYVDPTGEHSYENGICTACGAEQSGPIVITRQPTPGYALIGEKATVSVEAVGEGLKYQWYYKDGPDGSLTKSTITGSEYALTVKKTNVDRELYCVITDAHGNQVKTDVVRLLQPLEEELKIVTQPVPADAGVGEKATVFVEAQGVGLTYQWYFRNTPTGSLSKSTITSSSYSVTVSESNANRVVYCVITDAHGNQVTSETVSLIQMEDLVITKQPADAAALLGEKATVTVEAAGHPMTYNWYYRDIGDTSFRRSSITGPVYALTMTEARANREVYCVVTDVHGNQVTTETAMLRLAVKEELKILTQPVPDDAEPGEKATIVVEAQGDALKYTWYYKDAGKTSFTKSTITSNTYTLTVKETNANRVLYCVITDAHGNQVTTDTVNLIQVEELAITRQPADTSAVLGEKATVSVEAAGYPLKYTWYFRDAGTKDFQRSSISGSVYSLTMTEARANREVYCVVTDAHGNQVTTDTVTLGLAVKEELRIITQPVPDDAVIGEKATIVVEAQGDALKYAWYFKDAGQTDFTKSSITSSTYTLTVKESNMDRVLYCVITDAHGNQVTTDTVNLIRTGAAEEDPATYYGSLSDALSGTSGSPDQTGAAVKVIEESGKTCVVLLQNAELTETLTIANEVILDLNGYTIQSTASPAVNVEAEFATIRGGEISLTASGTGTSSAPSVAVLAKSGTTLEICDAKVTAVDAENGTVVGVLGQTNSELKLTGTTVLVTAETSFQNVGVRAYGEASLTDCTVIAESDYTGNAAGTNYASHAYGIIGEKDLTLVNCYVWGPHSGVMAKGNTFVDGGTYEGYGHGSFYFAGSNTTSYIYNASLNWAEMREGTYADDIAGTNGAGMYVGGGSQNVTVYMDNCQVYGTLYGIVLRNSGGEKNNSIYISNSTFTTCAYYAYRNGHNANNGTLKVFSGVGNDYSAITGKVSKYPAYYYETDESYAQMQASKTASVLPSGTVNVGDTVTYTLSIANQSNQDKTLSVTDTLPSNSTYLSGGEIVNGNEIRWDNLTVRGGDTVA